jgi:hypothetical protein
MPDKPTTVLWFIIERDNNILSPRDFSAEIYGCSSREGFLNLLTHAISPLKPLRARLLRFAAALAKDARSSVESVLAGIQGLTGASKWYCVGSRTFLPSIPICGRVMMAETMGFRGLLPVIFHLRAPRLS